VRVCVCECMYVCERERERESTRVWVCACVKERERVGGFKKARLEYFYKVILKIYHLFTMKTFYISYSKRSSLPSLCREYDKMK